MNSVLIQWGPTLLILFGILLGVIYNNRSINHLDTRISDLIRTHEVRHNDLIRSLDFRHNELVSSIDARHNDLVRTLDVQHRDLIRTEEGRHSDLKDFIKSEFRRLEDRIARLEHPIIRS